MSTSIIIYSPVHKMDIANLDDSTLKQLKYTQLLKLAAKANIKKRWAKKDDLIKGLLEAKQSMRGTEESRDNVLNEEIEEDWVDGGAMFKDIKPLSPGSSLPTFARSDSSGCSPNNGRSTFTVDKMDDSRGTYNLTNVINDILPNPVHFNRRETFNIPCRPARNNSAVTKTEKPPPKVKMLTVPYSKPGTRLTNPPAKQSPLKLSNKSLAIKKTKHIMSPLKPSRSQVSQLNRNRQTMMNQPPAKKSLEKVKSLVKRELSPTKSVVSTRPPLPRRKSKSDDPTMRRVSNGALANSSFRSPQVRPSTAAKITTVRSQTKGDLQKPVTRKKLPDFALIHQKQFEKMDSLDEYLLKKSDRVKKLFGTPTGSRPVERIIKRPNHDTSGGGLSDAKKITKPPMADIKPVKIGIQNAKTMLNRNPAIRAQTDVKDRNRSHIHGFRSNKRFELQMKFRNL